MSGLGLEQLPRSLRDAAPASVAPESQFSIALDAGLDTAGSQLNALASQAASQVGLDGVAADRKAAALRGGEAAAARGQGLRVPSYKEIGTTGRGTLSDVGDFVAGQAGQLLPSVGLGLAAGAAGALRGGPLGALAAGTAAFTPLEAGDIVNRQFADPESAKRSVTENSLRAVGGGAASSLLGNIVPAAMGGKLVGAGVRQGLRRSLASDVAENLMEGVVGQGVASAGSELTKQLSAGQAVDTGAITDAGIGGALAGVPLAGAGLAGDRLGAARARRATQPSGTPEITPSGADSAPQAPQTPSGTPETAARSTDAQFSAFQDALNAVKGTVKGPISDRVAAARIQAAELTTAPGIPEDIRAEAIKRANTPGNVASQEWLKAASDTFKRTEPVEAPPDTLKSLDAALSPDDTEARLKAGTPLGDLQSIVTASGDRLTQLLDEGAQKATAFTQSAVDQLKKRTDLTPEQRASLDAAATNLGDQASQAGVAALSAAKRAKDTATGLIKSLSASLSDAKDRVSGSKKSADYSGADAVIADTLAPYIAKNHPDLVSEPEVTQAMAGVVRQFVDRATQGTTRDADIRAMTKLLGPESERILTEAYSRLADPTGNAVANANLTKMSERIRAVSGKDLDLGKVIEQSLPEDSKADAGQLQEALVKWARGDTGNGPDSTNPSYHRLVRDKIQETFGDKADTVLKALEDYALTEEGVPGQKRRVSESDEVPRQDDAGETTQQPVDAVYHGIGDTPLALNKTVPDPQMHRVKYDRAGRAEELIKELQAKNPGKNVRYVSEADYNKARGLEGGDTTRGFIEVAGIKDPEVLNAKDLAGITLDTKKFGRSKSRLDVGDGLIVDAAKLTRHFLKLAESGTGLSNAVRAGRAFMQGVSALHDSHGKFDVPLDTVIDNDGTTFGDAVKAQRAVDTAVEAMSPNDKAKLENLRGQYKDAQAIGDTGAMARIADEATQFKADVRDRGIAGNDFNGGGAEFKADGSLTRAGAENYLNDQNLYDLPNDTNVVTAAAVKGEKGLARDTNLADDEPQAVSARAQNTNPLVVTARKFRAMDTAIGRKMAGRLEVLAKGIESMSERDQKRLLSVAGDGRDLAASQATINELAQKYKAVLTPTDKNSSRLENGKLVDAKGQAIESRIAKLRDDLQGNVDPLTYLKVSRIVRSMFDNGSSASDIRAATKQMLQTVVQAARTKGTREAFDVARATYDAVAGMAEQATVGIDNAPLNKAIKIEIGTGGKLGDVMGSFIEHGTDTEKVIARAIKKVAADVAVGFDEVPNALGVYYPSTHTITVSNAVRDRAAGTVLHEGVHAATVRGLADNAELLNAAHTLLGHVIEQDRGLAGRYASSNVLEFVAEGLSNPAIQERLRAIKPSEEVRGLMPGIKNMWEAFTSLVRQAMGIDAMHESALTQFLDLSGAALRSTKDASGDDVYKRLVDADLPVIRKEFNALFNKTVSGSGPAKREALTEWRKSFDGKITYARLVALGDLASDAYASITINDLKDAEFSLQIGGHAVPSELGSTPNPKAGAAKTAALDKAASSSDPALLKELRTATDVRALGRTAEHLAAQHPESKAAEAAGQRFDALVENPDTAYSMQRANGQPSTASVRADIRAHIDKVLGGTVKVGFKNIMHAGDFTPDTNVGDLIRISIHALDPRSVAYHESMHALFKQLRTMTRGNEIMRVLQKSADSPAVRRQVEKFFAGQPEVMKQLRGSDPEERAAYMYQLWADGQLQIAPAPKNVFQNVAKFIRDTLGLWSNDERALHIMDYFNSGEYAKDVGTPNAVAKATLDVKRNATIERARGLTDKITNLSDAVFASGSTRVRETGNAHLQRIADLIKPDLGDSKSGDVGFIAAARLQRTERLNTLGRRMGNVSKQHLAEALEALQNGTPAASPEARIAAREVKAVLQETYGYMKQAGVELGDLGPDYFPRVWDPIAISKDQAGFQAMLDKYVQSGQFEGDPKELMRRITANDGNAFDVDVNRPGNQHTKERLLAFIEGQDAAPFLNKDLYQTLNSYISQATRRAEWQRRFSGDDALNVLYDRAKKDGATNADIKLTEKYLDGVRGTLGDSLNPTWRRITGNLIVYQNVRLLPLAIFSSIVDPLGIAVRGGTIGDAFAAFKRGVREIPKNFKKDGGTKDWQTEMAEVLGTIDNALLTHTLGAMYQQGMTSDTGRKINDTLFRFNLMEQYNTSMRVAATQAAIHFVNRHGDFTYSKHSERWIDELGLQQSDIQRKPDGSLKLSVADGLSVEQADRMRFAINKWVDGAVLRPDAADRPIYYNDPRFALITHLKGFVYSFQHTIVDRVIHEAKEGNYVPAMSLATYVPVMLAADTVKGFITGGGQEPDWKKNWGAGDYLWYEAQRAGLLGVGQFRHDIVQDVQRGGVGIGAVAGPTLDQLADGIKAIGGRERFKPFAIESLPANALYKNALE